MKHTNFPNEVDAHTSHSVFDYLAMIAGIVALLAFIWWSGVIADSFIGLIEMV